MNTVINLLFDKSFLVTAFALRRRERHRDFEGRADADLAFERDAAAHALDDALADA